MATPTLSRKCTSGIWLERLWGNRCLDFLKRQVHILSATHSAETEGDRWQKHFGLSKKKVLPTLHRQVRSEKRTRREQMHMRRAKPLKRRSTRSTRVYMEW